MQRSSGLSGFSDANQLADISESEVSAMCMQVYQKLLPHTCFNVMRDSTQVVVVEENTKLTVPFLAAQETRTSTCFVWSTKRQCFTGVLTLTEYIRLLLYCDRKKDKSVIELTVKEWFERRDKLLEDIPSSRPAAFISVQPDASIPESIAKMSLNGIRRLPVFAKNEAGQEVDLGQEMSIISVITYQALLRFLMQMRDRDDPLEYNRGRAYGSIFEVPYIKLTRLGHAARERSRTGSYPSPVYVTPDQPLSAAFTLLLEKAIHAIPVLSPEGTIIDVIARSDVMVMNKIEDPIKNFRIRNNENPSESDSCGPVLFYEFEPLQAILERFTHHNVHVLFLVEPTTRKLLAQLSLNEVLTFFTEMSSEQRS